MPDAKYRCVADMPKRQYNIIRSNYKLCEMFRFMRSECYIRGGSMSSSGFASEFPSSNASSWMQAPSYMQSLETACYQVMYAECGGGGDCLFKSIATGLNEYHITRSDGVEWTVQS